MYYLTYERLFFIRIVESGLRDYTRPSSHRQQVIFFHAVKTLYKNGSFLQQKRRAEPNLKMITCHMKMRGKAAEDTAQVREGHLFLRHVLIVE